MEYESEYDTVLPATLAALYCLQEACSVERLQHVHKRCRCNCNACPRVGVHLVQSPTIPVWLALFNSGSSNDAFDQN